MKSTSVLILLFSNFLKVCKFSKYKVEEKLFFSFLFLEESNEDPRMGLGKRGFVREKKTRKRRVSRHGRSKAHGPNLLG